jgi:NADPH oxidase 5
MNDVVPSSRPASADERLLAVLDDAFAHLAGTDRCIDAAELQRALGLKSEYLARRVFALFDRDGDGAIARQEFLDRVAGLVFGTARQKLRFVFRLHDHNEDGLLTRQELHRMISLSIAEDEIATHPRHVDRLVNRLFLAADENGDGYVSFEEFEGIVSKNPAVLEQLTRNEARWIAPNEDILERLDRLDLSPMQRLAALVENRGAATVLVVLWGLANVALFAHAVWRYHELGANVLVQVARGCGACLNFNGALILLPMMRRFLTWLRRTWLGAIVPVDDSIVFHKVVGHAMFGFGLVHTLAHLTNYAVGTKKGFVAQLVFTRAGLTGLLLLVVFAVMWFFARGAIRRSGRFELFFFSHLLYWIWFPLALLHGPVFWIWAGVPLLGYLVDRLVRALRQARATEIVAGHALRSGVTRLEIKRPPGFSHRAGDYLFLNVPELAPHEWHPFTISSAPERDNISVHVRSLGNWTSSLRRFVEKKHQEGSHAPVPCRVDGPFGTPSVHIFEARHAVLIGAGIGVTPFASILESILLRGHGQSDRASSLRRVHFVWLNRDQYSFEWFAALLARLEDQDRDDLLRLHIYMTGGRADMTSASLSVARDLLQAEGYRDLLTGLRARTHMGRPDWDALLRGIVKEAAPERVDVFFCGPHALAREVQKRAVALGMRFRQEHF